MYRPYWAEATPRLESPHRRGDVPRWHLCEQPMDANLPTGVGMYRFIGSGQPQPNESPHRRGDVPPLLGRSYTAVRISPQAWGCTALAFVRALMDANLPTGVGMYRYIGCIPKPMTESPHRRGDVPAHIIRTCRPYGISPQAWGCTARPLTPTR